MASFFEELATYMDAQEATIIYAADANRNLFKDELPASVDPVIGLFGIVGTTVGESRDVKGMQFPRFQAIVRATEYEDGDALMQAVRDVLHGIIGVNLTSWRILRCHAEQDGGPIGKDGDGKHEFSINLVAQIHAI